AALVRQLGVDRADFFGYSMGAALALDLGLRYPDLVSKLVLASVSFSPAGLHPGLFDGTEQVGPEALAGSPFEQEYLRIAPSPQDWPVLIEKNNQLDQNLPDLDPRLVASLAPPALLVLGDSDIITLEHIVEMFRLLGGGVPGDVTGLPKCQLAVLPGTMHITVPSRADLLGAMIPAFLDA
ncbi:MAG: alpha/beta hydrolase, partial [Nocardiopsaceae bacterium]|nr:alpha/beta hydrolase [Nocardiopsaceae bacterium]